MKAKETEYTSKSQFSLIWHQFKKNKGAMIGLAIMIIAIIISIISPFIWDYNKEICGMFTSRRLQVPSAAHWFGTDAMGRDVFARVCYGTSYSLIIGFGSVIISTVLGTLIGAIAAYYGGKLEAVVLYIVEILMMIPNLLLAIIIVAVSGIGMTNLIIALGVATIPYFARTARATVMTVCRNEYVESAKAAGARDLTIIFKHVLPNSLSPIIVQITSRIGACIVTSASFSFLGLGVQVPTPEWGAMLADSRLYLRNYPHLIIFPGLAILITVLAVNLVGDGLRDALDPKLKS